MDRGFLGYFKVQYNSAIHSREKIQKEGMRPFLKPTFDARSPGNQMAREPDNRKSGLLVFLLSGFHPMLLLFCPNLIEKNSQLEKTFFLLTKIVFRFIILLT